MNQSKSYMRPLKKGLLASALLAIGFVGFNTVAKADTTSVAINVTPTTVNMTIPTSVALAFNADGTNTIAQNWAITNNTIGDIYLAQAQFVGNTEPGTSTKWQIAPDNTDMRDLPKDQLKVKFKAALVDKQATTPTASQWKALSVASDQYSATVNWTATYGLIPYGRNVDPATGTLSNVAAGSNTRYLKLQVDRGPFTKTYSGNKYTLNLTFSYK